MSLLILVQQLSSRLDVGWDILRDERSQRDSNQRVVAVDGTERVGCGRNGMRRWLSCVQVFPKISHHVLGFAEPDGRYLRYLHYLSQMAARGEVGPLKAEKVGWGDEVMKQRHPSRTYPLGTHRTNEIVKKVR